MPLEFKSSQLLRRHLINHVLSPPEAHSWYLLSNKTLDCLAEDDSALKHCFRLRSSLADEAKPDLAECEPLLDFYQQKTNQQWHSAHRLHWKVNCGNTTGALGIDGVMIIAETDSRLGTPFLRTAYIPGNGSAKAVKDSQQNPADPHRRASPASSMRRRKGHRRFNFHSAASEPRSPQSSIHLKSDDATSNTAPATSTEYEIYYQVVRPAHQFIRSYSGWRDSQTKIIFQMKDAIPRGSQLGYEQWLEKRQKDQSNE